MRSLRHDEVRLFYDVLTAAVRSSAGYGLDELPSFEYFARYYVDNFFNAVYELADTGQTVAFGNFGPSPYARSAAPALTDGNMVILPEFRNKRWFRQISMMNTGLANGVDLMRSVQGETSIANLANLSAALHMGYVVNGVLPKGIYFKDHGWMDLVMYYKNWDQLKPDQLNTLNQSAISKI